MKHTAVEWLYNNLKSHFEHDGNLLEVVQMSFEQAKEIEKEQIEETYWTSYKEGQYSGDKTADEYYNETFKSEPKQESIVEKMVPLQLKYNLDNYEAKAMENEKSYSYDELRTIAYDAYCLGQLNEPTEGKYNLWIQQFHKQEG